MVEGEKVLTALDNFQRAYSMLVGLAYALDLSKGAQVVVCVFLLSPQVNSLKSKVLAQNQT